MYRSIPQVCIRGAHSQGREESFRTMRNYEVLRLEHSRRRKEAPEPLYAVLRSLLARWLGKAEAKQYNRGKFRRCSLSCLYPTFSFFFVHDAVKGVGGKTERKIAFFVDTPLDND